MDLYQEEIMDHYRNPRNRGRLENPDFSSGEYNPSCGDSILFEGCVDEQGSLREVAFEGKGCVLSLATASMLSELCKGKLLEEILAIDKDAILAMLGGNIGPTRLKCALLPLQALQQGIAEYRKGKSA